ncbi:MAG: DUF2169 domain-containing protein [Vicinamibacterales bacterium]
MLQLKNQTPFKAAIAVLPDRAGIDTLYVIVKATITLRPALSLAELQVPPVMADEYYADPATSSLRAGSEMHIGKSGTDVLLVGRAWAPGKRPVRQMRVSMSVADRRKTIQITGDRVWRDGRPSDPQPFESMPLVWERAFGGVYRRGEQVLAEGRNPVGCGFAGGRSAADMQGQPVPNLEDQATPLQQLGETPAPACLAPIAPSWLPRRSFAGTYDEKWQNARAPYLPDDFDPRFFQSAASEFAFDRYLQGGEPVQVDGVTPDGPITFTVPTPHLIVAVTVAGSTEEPTPNLETLSIEPDENRACFTWRAALACDRKPLKVETIVVSRANQGGR